MNENMKNLHEVKTEMMIASLDSPKLMEELAAIEHKRWSGWYLHAEKNRSCENLKRWFRQANTPYENLSEIEKESDRKEVREYSQIIKKALNLINGEERESHNPQIKNV